MNEIVNILLLEDTPFDAELIERELRQSELVFSIKRVASRAAFLEELTNNRPDLVLSDYNLPQFNGLEALRLCKENQIRVPFILVTGSLNEDAVVAFMKEGVDDYILKSSLKRLPSAVSNALEKHQAEQEKVRALEALRQSEERFQLVARATNDAIWDWDLQANTVWWSDGARTLFGYEKGEVVVGPGWWQDRLYPQDKERVKAGVTAFIEGGAQFWSDEYRYRRADDTYALVIDRAFILRDPAGRAIRMIGSMMDITERRQAEERINLLAYYDELTGLPNRTLFENRLGQALSLAQRNKQLVAVMLLDLDRLRSLNESLGQAVGDSLLKQVAERLRVSVRGGDTVARFAGVGFALLLTQIGRRDDAVNVAQRAKQILVDVASEVIDGLKSPYIAEGHELFVTASVGISVYPDNGEDAPTLLRNAGAALSAIKEQGGGFHFYAASMNENLINELTLERQLRRALERGEFTLHYQPQVKIDTGQIEGVEALIRWQSPELGPVSPANFIPLAEKNGLIVPIGEWSLRTACAQAKAWQDEGLPPLRMSVNLSPRQFEQPDLTSMVAGVLEETGLDPGSLELELTESSIMKNAEHAIVILDALRKMKIQIAVDDFGSGYSSLSYLKRFPIDRLKIDQSFVSDATSDPTDAAIIMAIITLAHNLRLKVTAEGVETEEQLRFLHILRCDEMQGYLFSRPVPPEALKELLLGTSSRVSNAVSVIPGLQTRTPLLGLQN